MGQQAPAGETPGQRPLLAGRHVGTELSGGGHGFGSQLKTQAAALLIRVPVRLLGESADGQAATLPPAVQPREKRRRGATRPALMVPGCPVGVVHTRSRMGNQF